MARMTALAAAVPLGVALAQSPSTPTTPSAPPPAQPPSSSSSSTPSSMEPERAPDAQAEFRKLDGDQDGRISKTEAAMDEELGPRFDRIDDDGDGYVDSDEYRELARARKNSAGE
jgi:Ca2+-binding EF-hand superfamily protein